MSSLGLETAQFFAGSARAPAAAAMESCGCGATPVVASPYVLPAPVLRAAVERCQAIRWTTLDLLRRWRAGDARLAGMLVPADGMDTLLEHGDVPLMQRCRMDVIVDAQGGMHLLELQVGDPSGAAWSDVLLDAVARAPGYARWTAQRRVAATPIVAAHARLLRQEGARVVGLVCDPGMFAVSDNRLHGRLLSRHHVRTTAVVDPRDVVVQDGRVRVDDLPVDTLLRDSVDDFLAPAFRDRTAALRNALQHRVVRLHNPFWDALLDDKGILEWLHDAGVAGVPCTALVYPRRTRWKGVEGDLLEALRRDRAGCVLKPRDGYGGFGVVVGRDCSQAAWETALQDAVAQAPRFVAQAFVETPQTWAVDAQGELQERFVTLSLWLVAGQYAGAFARVSQRRVTNVHSGGGMMAVYMDEGPA